jgi:hypothetical protein
MSETAPPSNEPIVARYGSYYRNTRYILTLILFIMAGWFAYDGWKAWPAANAKAAELETRISQTNEKDRLPLQEERRGIKTHTELDLLAQRALAVFLPLVGIALTMWARHNSRGEIKLAGDRLSAPGHPEISLDDVTALDQRLWDRKDIAYVQYEKGDVKGRIRLDAFIYEAEPIVKICERIEKLMKEDADAAENPTNT